MLAFALHRGLGFNWDPTLNWLDGMILVVVTGLTVQQFHFVERRVHCDS